MPRFEHAQRWRVTDEFAMPLYFSKPARDLLPLNIAGLYISILSKGAYGPIQPSDTSACAVAPTAVGRAHGYGICCHGAITADIAVSPALTLILYVLLPLWLAAGLADWTCHRATAIEHTSGAKESVLHLIMLVQIGLPVLAALLFEPNALVFALLIGGFLLHQLTELWDVIYSEKSRRITPIEQQVHSAMEMLPFAIIVLLASMHWAQFCALFGIGDERARFVLAARTPAISPTYLAGLGCAIVLFGVLPYLEELLRCLRTNREAAPASREPASGTSF